MFKLTFKLAKSYKANPVNPNQRNQPNNQPKKLDLFDYIGMILLSPFFIIIEGSKWLYNNRIYILNRMYLFACQCVETINRLYYKIGQWVNNVMNLVSRIIIEIEQFILKIQRALIDPLIEVYNMVRAFLNNIYRAIYQVLNTICINIRDFLTRVCCELYNVLHYVILSIGNWITRLFGYLCDGLLWCSRKLTLLVNHATILFRQFAYDFYIYLKDVVWPFFVRICIPYIEELINNLIRFVWTSFNILKRTVIFLWKHVYSHLLYPLYYYLIYVPFYELMYCTILYPAYASLYGMIDSVYMKLYEIYMNGYFLNMFYDLYENLYNQILIVFEQLYNHIGTMYQNMCEKVFTVYTNLYILFNQITQSRAKVD